MGNPEFKPGDRVSVRGEKGTITVMVTDLPNQRDAGPWYGIQFDRSFVGDRAFYAGYEIQRA